MKKIICMILILSFIFSFTACGKKKDVNNKETNTPTTSDVTEETKSESKETTESTEPTTSTIASDSTTVSTESKNETTEGSNGTTPPKSETTPSKGTTPPSTTNPPTTNPPATNPPTTPPTVKTCNHSNTEVRNKEDATTSSEGYTGDTYCKDCGKLISSGSSVPKIKQTYTATHDYYDIEMEIFRLINEERTKNGLPAYVWDEELYPGTKVRVGEINSTWSHTRPNGSSFITAITENSNYMMSSFRSWGENIAESCGYSNATEVAKNLFTKWYNSPGHRANMLDASFNCIAIAVANIGYEDYIADNVFICK